MGQPADSRGVWRDFDKRYYSGSYSAADLYEWLPKSARLVIEYLMTNGPSNAYGMRELPQTEHTRRTTLKRLEKMNILQVISRENGIVYGPRTIGVLLYLHMIFQGVEKYLIRGHTIDYANVFKFHKNREMLDAYTDFHDKFMKLRGKYGDGPLRYSFEPLVGEGNAPSLVTVFFVDRMTKGIMLIRGKYYFYYKALHFDRRYDDDYFEDPESSLAGNAYYYLIEDFLEYIVDHYLFSKYTMDQLFYGLKKGEWYLKSPVYLAKVKSETRAAFIGEVREYLGVGEPEWWKKIRDQAKAKSE